MFVDFEAGSGPRGSFDVCIVGAGIAGLTTAWALRQHGATVLIVEGGGLNDEARSQAIYDTSVEFAARHNRGVSAGRFRVFGGTGTRWGAQLIPLAFSEFASTYTTAGAEWPIGLNDLEPHFATLGALFDLKGTPFDSSCYQRAGRRPRAPDDGHLTVRFSKWLPWRKRNIGRYFQSRLERDHETVVLYHANAIEIVLDDTGSTALGVRLRSYGGREEVVAARSFVISTGTIETIRLLFASSSRLPDGLGNSHDLVGRYFMDHAVLRAGVVEATDRKALFQAIRPFFVGDVLHTPRFELASNNSNSRPPYDGLSAYAQITFEAAPDSAFAVLRAMFHTYQGEGLRGLSKSPYWKLIRGMPDLLAGFVARTALGLRPIPARSTPVVSLFSEQPPRANSRVYPTKRRDILGMPKMVMNWRIGEEEGQALRSIACRFEAYLRDRHLGVVRWFNPQCQGANIEDITDQYHHLGGARMGATEQDGVVDRNCRIFRTTNIYIASGAVFPTSGCSNPTFTIMALALRLAEHLVSPTRN